MFTTCIPSEVLLTLTSHAAYSHATSETNLNKFRRPSDHFIFDFLLRKHIHEIFFHEKQEELLPNDFSNLNRIAFDAELFDFRSMSDLVDVVGIPLGNQPMIEVSAARPRRPNALLVERRCINLQSLANVRLQSHEACIVFRDFHAFLRIVNLLQHKRIEIKAASLLVTP